MQSGQHALDGLRHGGFAGGALDGPGHPQIDRVHAPHAVGEGGGPVGGEGEVVVLAVVVAHDLVGQHGPVALAPVEHLPIFVTPDADHRLDGGALDLIQIVAASVAGIGDVGQRRRLLQGAPAVEIDRQRRREGHRRDDLVAHEGGHILVAGRAQGVAVTPVARARHDDNAVQAAEVIAHVVEAAIRRLAAQRFQVQQVQAVEAARGADRARVAQGFQAAEGEHDLRAAEQMPLGHHQRVCVVAACEDKHHLPGEVFQALVGPGHQPGAALRGHPHAVGHLDVVPGHAGGFLGGQIRHRRRHVHRRGVAVLVLALGRLAPRNHQGAKFPRGGARGRLLQGVHIGEDRVDALGFDGAGEQGVHANAVLVAEFPGQADGQRVESGFGHHIRYAAVVVRARKNRGYVDDGAAAAHMRHRGARHVPGPAEQIHGGIEQGFVIAPGAALGVGEGNIAQRAARAGAPCVVDQHIDARVALDGRGHDLATHLGPGAVAKRGQHVLARKTLGGEFFDKSVQLAFVAAGHDQFRALAQQAAADEAADVAGGAGENDDFVQQAATAGGGRAVAGGWVHRRAPADPVSIEARDSPRCSASRRAQARYSSSRVLSPARGSAWVAT